jgi:hypothetical protein
VLRGGALSRRSRGVVHGASMSELAIHPIPPITDPLGRSWEQPGRECIEVDEKFALMSRAVFDLLPEYSCSNPTGAYEGKMWKRHDGSFDREFLARGGKPTWLLCWYGVSDKPGYVSNNFREIILADGELPA